jgi:predicted SprT family Zn-dependent metalloprotease
MKKADPTSKTYNGLTEAYAFFNARLFDGKLPACLITMQRKAKAYGYFAGGRFGSKDGSEIADEIALNPTHFKGRGLEDSLSTLVHEMAHLWQHHFGKPSRTGYHNKEWAACMAAIGLIPSDTGEPGGKQVGQNMSHYIEPGGRFQKAFGALAARGFDPLYVELWDEAESRKTRKTKAASKTWYTCPDCQTNAWAKPDVHLVCGECNARMVAEESEV